MIYFVILLETWHSAWVTSLSSTLGNNCIVCIIIVSFYSICSQGLKFLLDVYGFSFYASFSLYHAYLFSPALISPCCILGGFLQFVVLETFPFFLSTVCFKSFQLNYIWYQLLKRVIYISSVCYHARFSWILYVKVSHEIWSHAMLRQCPKVLRNSKNTSDSLIHQNQPDLQKCSKCRMTLWNYWTCTKFSL